MKNIRSDKYLHAVLCMLFILFAGIRAIAQPTKGYDKNYHFLHSDNLVVDKDFYLLTVIDQSPAIKKLFSENAYFKQLFNDRLALLKSHTTDTCSHPESLVGGFRYTKDDSVQLAENVLSLYKAHQRHSVPDH